MAEEFPDIRQQIKNLTPEQVEVNIQEQAKRWHEDGINPGMISFDLFVLDAQVHALALLLVELDIIKQEDINLAIRRKILENLVEGREQVKEAKSKMIQQQIAASVPPVLPRMDIPRGKRR
jgi:hypothetical protein